MGLVVFRSLGARVFGRCADFIAATMVKIPRRARGLRLLRTWLSPAQSEQFNAKGYFDVIGSATGSKYRIQYGTSMNVYELDDTGRLKMGWCFVPQGCLVVGDVMLAQKIALETFESRALLVAKRFAPIERLRL